MRKGSKCFDISLANLNYGSDISNEESSFQLTFSIFWYLLNYYVLCLPFKGPSQEICLFHLEVSWINFKLRIKP